MSFKEEILIDLVYKLPHLWDKKDPNYKDKVAVENGWESISQVLHMRISNVQYLWANIRTKYLKERRQLKNLPSGSGAQKTWHLFEKLGFLDAVIATRKTKGNILKSNEESSSSEIWDELSVNEDGFQEETIEIRSYMDDDDSQTPSTSKHRLQGSSPGWLNQPRLLNVQS
ncbi:unnamed protein product [Psylliodes chrysocephalus]|uniref:MADF domain-containing protein n=1 Tax=Psylliodes chrysocephalus TaxID=3402493 RepID=A0A9P0CWC0_9CUCU|nr:unnamed protein product [Psylliodes chrysocephala]